MGVAVVAFLLGQGNDAAGPAPPATGAGGSTSPGGVTLQTACAEIAPDMAFRVDALRRTAELIRADIATMQAAGNTADAAQAAKVADALDAAAAAVNSQTGVHRATRRLGQALASIC